MLDHFLHHDAGVAQVLTGIEMVGMFRKMFADSRRKGNAEVGIDIDFADRHFRRLAQLGFGNTDGVGHMSAEFVDDRHLVLRNGRRAVEDDGEAGKPPADFFENVEAKLGILTGLEFISAVEVPIAMARESIPVREVNSSTSSGEVNSASCASTLTSSSTPANFPSSASTTTP